MSVLSVDNVSIRYMTGDFKDIGLKEYILRKITNNYRVVEFWADKNISFDLDSGDVLGIIGTNGSGKSTLLKVISGIMEPSEGVIKRKGNIAALLELASGFDGDLTVRENTYLRGAMLGYTKKYMDETYDSIIEFAELKDFQDRPFKQLSTGMKSRLAFSIASLVKPDILILDEVLSVGDGSFRKKSEEKMKDIIRSGATTILVSHSMEQIRQMCNKVLWIDKGIQIEFGDNVKEICDRYEDFLIGKTKLRQNEVGVTKTKVYNKENSNDNKQINKRERLDIGLLAIAAILFSLTFLICGPIQLYLSNITELWFSPNDLIGVCLLTGAIGSVVLFVVGTILIKPIRKIYVCILIGVSIGLYIQGNFVQTDYGVLNGNEIAWEQYTSTAIWNTLLWIVCLIAPFAVLIILKNDYRKCFCYTASLLSLVQVLAICIMALTTDYSTREIGGLYLSTKNLYNVSDKENVITFVLDMFDVEYFNEILKEEPSFLEPLDGFTFFNNTTCAYPTTKGSIPFMLTEKYYENEKTYSEYIIDAYHDTDFYDTLKKTGYKINLYTDELYVSNEALESYVENSIADELKVSSKAKLELYMLRLTAFRYFPHIAKKYVWFYNGNFEDLKTVSGIDDEIYASDNIPYYQELKKSKLQIDNSSKYYTFIHLEGAHNPFNLNEDVTLIEDGTGSAIKKAKASLNIVFEYIKQLQQNNVYDNSLIIITADHGFYDGSPTSPIFLIKTFNERGSLRISDVPISHANLHGTIMNELGLNTNNKYGISVFDISSKNAPVRRYLSYNWNSEWESEYLPDMKEYSISPNGNEKMNFMLTGNIYTPEGISHFTPYSYHIGETITFDDDNDGTQYFAGGISKIEGNFVWSFGNTGCVILNTESQPADCNCEIKFDRVYSPPQKLIITCDNETLFDGIIDSENLTVNFAIPKDCFKDGIIVLDLQYPDAVSPNSLSNSDDTRVLAVGFSSIRLS